MTLAVGKVERSDGGAAARRVNPLLDLLERRGSPGDENDVRSGGTECFCGCRANAAAGAGHNREAAGEGF